MKSDTNCGGGITYRNSSYNGQMILQIVQICAETPAKLQTDTQSGITKDLFANCLFAAWLTSKRIVYANIFNCYTSYTNTSHPGPDMALSSHSHKMEILLDLFSAFWLASGSSQFLYWFFCFCIFLLILELGGFCSGKSGIYFRGLSLSKEIQKKTYTKRHKREVFFCE